ncbi:MAG TPA: SWIM zinc finger family protein, partial [Chloroflexota bacterium]|nr:SWIM zinc finger family protein [Chloroflexota bacterium]
MNAPPRVTLGVLGGLVDLVPARLRRRLDAEPDIAERWSWSRSAEPYTVVVSPDVQVTIASDCVSAMSQVSCTCLLAPRCLHIAAVLARLPLADEPASDDIPTDEDIVRLSVQQRAAAEQAWTAAAALLDAGASGAGLLLTSELLRAVHSCREAGLHRAAASGLRVAQRLRDLQAARPQFRLGALAADLADLLSTSRQLTRNTEVQAEWLGTARRAYRPLGSLRLSGIFTEAVLSATGYAGVVSYVCDQRGRLWSLADVTP